MTGFERLVTWSGGLAFTGSLAFTAWWYVVWLGIARPFAGWVSAAYDALIFSVFALHHSLLARPAAHAVLARVCPERLMRSLYVWTASLLLILVCLLWRPVGGDAFRLSGTLTLVHRGAQLAGLVLIALSVRAIDPLELAGIRRSDRGQVLRITGPYRLVRHPLYLGWMLVVFGTAHMTGDRLAFAAISSLYVVIAVPWEEGALERQFGDAYRRYKRTVRWRIIPYVY
jgi:protein-S-isoprenylcysteine O-methyltransferase Ste14